MGKDPAPVGPVRREAGDDRRAKSPATTPSGLQGGTGRQRSHGRGAQENGGRIPSGWRNGDGAILGGFWKLSSKPGRDYRRCPSEGGASLFLAPPALRFRNSTRTENPIAK